MAATANKRLQTGEIAIEQGATAANGQPNNVANETAPSQWRQNLSESLNPEFYLNGRNSNPGITPSKTTSTTSEDDFDKPICIGNEVEALYGATDKGETPRKRTGQEAFGRAFLRSGHSENEAESELGEYHLEQRRKAANTSKVVSNNINHGQRVVIDLTLDDDDEVTVISEKSSLTRKLPQQAQHSQESITCYGCISPIYISVHRVPAIQPDIEILHADTWPRMIIKLFRGDLETGVVHSVDHEGNTFGKLRGREAEGLAALMDRRLVVETEAILQARHKGHHHGRQVGDHISTTYQCSVNLYGLSKNAILVANFLLQPNYSIRLQPQELLHKRHNAGSTPDFKVGIRDSRNLPAGWGIGGIQRSAALNSGQGYGYVDRTVEEVNMDIKNVFDSILSSEELPDMEPDPRVKTPLLKHQKQGLWFMMQKEKDRVFGDKEEDNSSLWRLRSHSNGHHVFYHVITGEECRQQPPQVRGGILADMMGLGKTLSVLSLILTTLNNARCVTSIKRDDGRTLAKTTLLVAPLSTIQNWEEQISAHIEDGALSYYIYHGAGRELRVDKLVDYDLIITTYKTVNNEFIKHEQRPSPLQQIHYYRIALDEAHIIREAGTKQFKAIHALSSDRRWAVTGTPIQNKLEDLASLIRFIRLRPFDDKRIFIGYIGSGSKGLNSEQVIKLRLLVDSVTLRRHKDKISLPPRRDKISYLEFSQAERKLYDAAAAHTRGKVKDVLGQSRNGKLTGRNYIHILRTILKMRQICAHGRDLLSEEDQATYVGLSSQDAIDLDEIDENSTPAGLSASDAYRALKLMQEAGEDKCSMCQRKTGPSLLDGGGASENNAPNEALDGFLSPCMHLICKDCKDKFVTLVADSNPERTDIEEGSPEWRVCPLCTTYTRMKLFELTTHGYIQDESQSQGKNKGGLKERYRGPSTKVQALLKSLQDNRRDSRPGSPIKSVVFSSWTCHLDLIQFAFERYGISYVRLDGSMNRKARQDAITALRDNPTVEVILISIAAGGLGLNLTSASRVYVMEPQFNPAAEQQAVDRVYRLGQTREVICVRYIMKGSFEEKILKLQERKLEMAEQGLGKKGVSRQRIMELFQQI